MHKISRSLLLGLAVSTLSATALTACSSAEGSDSTATDQIKILVAAPLTGSSAESGQDMVNGALLAAEYLNEQGGVKTGPLEGAKFVIESVDDQLATEAATTIAARVVDDESIFGLTGFITSGQAQAAGIVLNRAGLGAVVSFASADFLTEQADNLVVVSASVGNYARVAGDFASSELGAKKIGAVSGDFSFLDSYYKGLEGALDKNAAELVSKQTYTEGTSDFSTLLTNIDSSSPDVLMLGAFQADAGKIVSQARQATMDYDIVDFLGEGWGDTFGKAAGSSLNQGNVYQMDPADVFPEPGTLLAEIDEQFEEKHGKNIPTSSMHTFDSILTIAAAIEAGAQDREQLVKFIPKASGTGLLGPIGFTEDLLPKERIGTVSKVTGAGARDRELSASYVMRSDSTVERKD